MSKRVRLRFDRSQDPYTSEYYVYRSTSPGVDTTSPLIAKLRHPAVESPMFFHDDKVTRVSENVFQLSHQVILKSYPFRAYIDGIENTGYVVDYDSGHITFDFPIPLASTITADYYFDGVEFIDDYLKQDIVIQYYGPPAIDNSKPTTPTNVSLVVHTDQVSATVQYAESTISGRTFYYRVEARSASGDRSNLSNEISGHLTTDLLKYQIDSSTDTGVTWKLDGETTNLYHTIFGVDHEPPEPLQNTTATVTTLQNTGTSDITFNWDGPLLNNKGSVTPMFRVWAISAENVMSDVSSSVGPEKVKSPLAKVVIRRKIADGSYPSFNGTDAVTVAEITNLDTYNYTDNVEGGKTYAYSLFVVDGSGNYSQAVVFELFVEDTSAPVTVTGVTIGVHNTIV